MPVLDLKCALENAGLVLALGMLAVQDIVLQLFDRYDGLCEVGQQFHSRKGKGCSIAGRTMPAPYLQVSGGAALGPFPTRHRTERRLNHHFDSAQLVVQLSRVFRTILGGESRCQMTDKKKAATCETSEPEVGCPIPSAHDKLGEAHYFIHELIKNYHFPDEFRYSLSAFFQAARSTTLMIQSELAHYPGFDEWWKAKQELMKNDAELKLSNEFRVTTFHKSSLIPGSRIFAGHFKYGRPKSGLVMPLSPMTPTLEAFLSARRLLANQEHPHRQWSGEECGIQRTWQLSEIPERELVEFCIGCWEKIAVVVAEAHSWRGATFETEAKCKHSLVDYRTLRESEIFFEVEKAWESSPTEVVEPKSEGLKFLAGPHADSETCHTIAKGERIEGWVGGTSDLWDPSFVSMLIYSVNGEPISENTTVFFNFHEAVVKSLEMEEENERDHDGEEG